VSKLYPQEWEAAMRVELGITAEEQQAQEDSSRVAADDRLARGERDLHAAKIAAARGAQ
jgi:hypothetical protein